MVYEGPRLQMQGPVRQPIRLEGPPLPVACTGGRWPGRVYLFYPGEGEMTPPRYLDGYDLLLWGDGSVSYFSDGGR